MRRVRFRDPAGAVRTGAWTADGLHFGGIVYDPTAVDVLPPSKPTKLVCVGRNYADHAAEENLNIPDRPALFLKPPNAVAGHGDVVALPPDATVEYEAELGVVIGEQCRRVAVDDAMDVVRGFTCVNDVSNRDEQRREQNYVRAKGFDGAAPIGPVVADPERVPTDARVRLRHNGTVRQDSSRDELIFGVPELIAAITEHLTLEPGDIVSTGTPAGVGPLADGDEVEIEIEGVGTLRNETRLASR